MFIWPSKNLYESRNPKNWLKNYLQIFLSQCITYPLHQISIDEGNKKFNNSITKVWQHFKESQNKWAIVKGIMFISVVFMAKEFVFSRFVKNSNLNSRNKALLNVCIAGLFFVPLCAIGYRMQTN